MNNPALVIAIHGTRSAEGQAVGRALTQRVAAMLSDVDVRDAYVELDTPTIADALASALETQPDRRAVVVPLMLGQGGHVLEDIPEAVAEGRARVGSATVITTPHLGPDSRLRAAVIERVAAQLGDWTPEQVGVVFLGRGCSVTRANADHARLTRVVGEEGGYGFTVPAYIQVVRPSLIDALNQLKAVGFQRIVIAPNYMFPGRLQNSAAQQAADWATNHGIEVRLADVIGDCDALAEVVVDRYRTGAAKASAGRRGLHTSSGEGSPMYLAGLDLRGRRVLMAGAGTVAARRVPALLAAGADLHVVALAACPDLEAWASGGALTLELRPVTESDVEGARYAIAATDDPDANAMVADACEARGIFCVRADRSDAGTARTPATGTFEGLTVGVIGDRVPHRSKRARDAAVAAIATL